MEEKNKITNFLTFEKKNKDIVDQTKDFSNKIISKKESNSHPQSFFNEENIYKNKELNKFKDEILTYLRTRDYYYMEKINSLKSQIDKNERNYDNLNDYSTKNFNSLISSHTEIISKLEKLNTYDTFMDKTNDKFISYDIRINCLRDDLSKNAQKYDKIYLDNLEVPGYIGRCSKYPNCKLFFIELIKEIDKLNNYREKNTLDLCTYKDRLENIIKTFQSMVENNNDSQLKYITKLNEKTNKTFLDTLEEKINNVRLDNSQFATDLINRTSELNELYDKMKIIKEDVLNEFCYKSVDFEKKVDDINKSFDLYKIEYATIRKKFLELAEFIKNGKYSKTFANMYGKKEVNSMTKKLVKESKEVIEAKDVTLLSNIDEIDKMDYKPEKVNTNKTNINNDINNNNTKNNIIDRMSKSQNNFNINKKKKKRNFGFMRDIEKNIMANQKEKNRNSIDNSDNIKVHQGAVFYLGENKAANIIKKQNNNITNNNRRNIKGRKIENENIGKKTNEDLEDINIEKIDKDEKISNNNKEEISSMSESYLSNINNSINTFSTTNEKNNSMNSLINLNSNKNCNKFNLLEDDLKNNDKIIKELASELEQSTAKVNKLASNKKEIEDNFKNICNKIQPINLKLVNSPLEQIPEQKIKDEKESTQEQKENNIENNINKKQNINNSLVKEELNQKEKNRYSITSKSELNTTIVTKNDNINNNTNNNFSINNNINYETNSTNHSNGSKKGKDLMFSKSKITLESKEKSDDNTINKISTSTSKSNRGKVLSKIANSNQIWSNDNTMLNNTINSNIDKKLNVYDKKLGDLESFTREQIYEILKQISLIKKAYSFVAGVIKKDKFGNNNNMRLSGHNTSHNVMGSGNENFFNNYVNNENKNTMNITGNNFRRKSLKNDTNIANNNKSSNNGKIIQTMDDINFSDNLFYNGKYYFNIKDILEKYKNNINLNTENKKILKKLDNKLQEDSNRNRNNSPNGNNQIKGDKLSDAKKLGKSSNKMIKSDNDSMNHSMINSEKK